jgi:hypothetical protein
MNRKSYPVIVTLSALACVAFVATVSTAVSASPIASARLYTYPSLTAGAKGAPLSPLGSGFTYHGRLTQEGSPANGTYDIQFTLYDAPSGGNQVGTPILVSSQTITEGLFTVQLDFGPSAFQGSARWLQIGVQPSGGGAFTTLSPRQALTAAPYALSLMPGATITGTLSTSPVLSVTNSSSASFAVSLFGNASGSSGIGVKGTGGFAGLYGTSTSNGVYGISSSTTGVGVYGSGSGALGYGVRGDGGQYGVVGSGTSAGVSGTSYDPSGYGVQGTAVNGTNGAGVYGLDNGTHGMGVRGEANSGSGAVGVFGISNSGYGVYGVSYGIDRVGVKGQADGGSNAMGVYGTSSSGYGMFGSGTLGVYGIGIVGVLGETTNANGFGVRGNGPTGVYAEGSSYGVFGNGRDYGVYGSGAIVGVQGLNASTAGGAVAVQGVLGNNLAGGSSAGVQGVNNGTAGAGIGVWGEQHGFGYGVYGTVTNVASGYAGYFNGRVRAVNGCCNGPQLNTQIDDPLDPANKYLNRSVVESADMLNMVSGNAILDSKGEVTIPIPAWFEATGRDFRYQFDPIGAPAPDLYVARELQNNTFRIAGGKPGMKVSWQVTGVRNDPYAQAHPLTPEQDKPADERGYYLNPELYGRPTTKSVDQALRNPPPPPLQTEKPPTQPALPGDK